MNLLFYGFHSSIFILIEIVLIRTSYIKFINKNQNPAINTGLLFIASSVWLLIFLFSFGIASRFFYFSAMDFSFEGLRMETIISLLIILLIELQITFIGLYLNILLKKFLLKKTCS